jgi:beta-phosphoglucomutase-like phosphatase (HAD superfamily)
VHQAASAIGVDPRTCVVVGDIGSDVRAAVGAGARAVLVPNGATRPAEVLAARLRWGAQVVVERDLDAASRRIARWAAR